MHSAAQELRELVFTKYDKTYDMSFVRRDIPGKTFVSRGGGGALLRCRACRMVALGCTSSALREQAVRWVTSACRGVRFRAAGFRAASYVAVAGAWRRCASTSCGSTLSSAPSS